MPKQTRKTPLVRQARRIAKNAADRFFNTDAISLAGQTPFATVYDNGLVRLRHYGRLDEPSIIVGGEIVPVETQRHRVPLVIVPPLAVNMLIYDLFPERSLVKYFMARGFDVYMIDWGRPSRRYSHYNLETYVAHLMPIFLHKVREHSGKKELSLHGWSMGGHFSLCYSALGDDPDIRNLVILGSHVDSHASGAIGQIYERLNRAASVTRRWTKFSVDQLHPQLFHSKGWMNALTFKLTNPIGSVMGYWELLMKLGDRKFVIDHATNSSFLDNMVDYPGGIVQDMFIRVWLRNELSHGYFHLGARTLEFKNIKCPLLVLAGESDTLATPAAVKHILNICGSEDQTFEQVPGGHMGIVSGSKAPATAWKLTADWLAARSH
ncbi:MAG TPA: alpha/beta fold hydrolase [Pseudomonadales bacterium]|nr:alpha/beta fold hydrolase [Pseudomonadales bacterium]